MVAREIQVHFGVPEQKLKLVYNAVDTQRFHPALKETWRLRIREQLGIPPQAFVHLCVGSGFERKGVPQLLAAARGLPGDVHVAGQAPRGGQQLRHALALETGTDEEMDEGVRRNIQLFPHRLAP